jgi:4-hydroxyacetophenone monooxygenase
VNGPDRAAATAHAVAIANIPTLLMVLVQLTGETRWLEPPYRPVRQRGMGDNDTGGLPDEIQAEIREAALEAIHAWQEGRPVAIPHPSDELLVEMLACAMAERVPDEYGPMIRAQLRTGLPVVPDVDVPEGFRVLIIGAGASGITASVSLRQMGVPFTIIEKSSTVGGVWWDNKYPGAGVDTPNHLYSFSFLPYDWSMYFALRDELHAYMSHAADTFGLRQHIRFNTEVLSAEYDAGAQEWAVTVRNPDSSHEVLRCTVLISATGIFNPLKYPKISGLDTFAGPAFHTAAWRNDVDVRGKRVAIVGNGASSMQTAPEIQPIVDKLTIFQRSKQWAAPFEQFRKVVPDPIRFLFQDVPLYRQWYRVRLGWTFNDRIFNALHKDPEWEHPERSLNAQNDMHREYFTQYIQAELGDRTDLIDKVVPTYPPFGKRMLMDNGWFRMLTKPNVELVTDAIDHIEPDAIVTADGSRHEADVVIIATGFDVLRFLTSFEARGRTGRTLREVWDDDDARAYMGMTVPEFPNLFVMYGPNTQPGHGGSLIFVLEMLVNYMTDMIRQMIEQNIGSFEVRRDVHDRYNEAVDAAHEQMVWTHPGMETYYRNARGRVVVNYPFRNVDLFNMTRRADLADFIVEPRRVPAASSA